MSPASDFSEVLPRLLQRRTRWLAFGVWALTVLLLVAVFVVEWLDTSRRTTTDRLLAIRDFGAAVAVQPIEGAGRALSQFARLSGAESYGADLARGFEWYRSSPPTARGRSLLQTQIDQRFAPKFRSLMGEAAWAEWRTSVTIADWTDEAVNAQLAWGEIFAPESDRPDAQGPRSSSLAGDAAYSVSQQRIHQALSPLLALTGGEDVLLVAEDGVIIYTERKGLDFGTSLVKGPWSATQAGLAWRALQDRSKADGVWVSDIADYPADYGRSSLFLGVAIAYGGGKKGALLLRLDGDVMTRAIADALATQPRAIETLGHTADVYLVGADGSPRSATRLARENPSHLLTLVRGRIDPAQAQRVNARRSDVGTHSVASVALSRALEGEEGVAVHTDWDERRVWSAFGPVRLSNQKWAVIARVDVTEVSEHAVDLWGGILSATILAGVVTAVMVSAFLRQQREDLVKPLQNIRAFAVKLAFGLHPNGGLKSRDDFGALNDALRRLSLELQRLTVASARALEPAAPLAAPEPSIALVEPPAPQAPERVAEKTLWAQVLEQWLPLEEALSAAIQASVHSARPSRAPEHELRELAENWTQRLRLVASHAMQSSERVRIESLNRGLRVSRGEVVPDLAPLLDVVADHFLNFGRAVEGIASEWSRSETLRDACEGTKDDVSEATLKNLRLVDVQIRGVRQAIEAALHNDQSVDRVG